MRNRQYFFILNFVLNVLANFSLKLDNTCVDLNIAVLIKTKKTKLGAYTKISLVVVNYVRNNVMLKNRLNAQELNVTILMGDIVFG